MKVIILATSMLFSLLVFSQPKIPKPLPNSAFNKMIVQDITYAIVGESTPTSGLKIDISKPEATVSGLFKPKSTKVPWNLFSFDFKGGITDRNFSILQGYKSFNTGFEFKPSFHFIPKWSSAKFGIAAIAKPNSLIVNAKNKIVLENSIALKDTIIAIALLREHHLNAIGVHTDPTISVPLPINISPNQKLILVYFIKKIMNNPALPITGASSIANILAQMPQVTQVTGPPPNNYISISGVYMDEVEETYKKYTRLFKNSDKNVLSQQINNASELWTKKRYFWFTASPFARTEKVNEYYDKFEGRDSFYFKSDYRFYYGLTGTFNWYVVYPNKIASFFRAGITLSRNNNLTGLSSYNYETRRPFFNYGTTITEKTKTGSAYNHNDIKKDFSSQLNLEYYLLPLKSLVPGLFLSSGLNYGGLYKLPNVIGRENDKAQIATECGLVFNVNSREKDKEKSILSLIFYFRHEDITDKRRTDVLTQLEETRDEFRKRNLGMGIRVGIPITLPQRND